MQSEATWDALGEYALADWAQELALDAGDDVAEANRFTARALRETVAALAWSVPEVAPSPHLCERLLQKVARDKEKRQAVLPPPALLTVRTSEGQWHEVAPGVTTKRLFVDPTNGQITALYRFAAGARLGSHRHRGHEQCYVLEGDFTINGQRFGPGDFQCATPDSIHAAVTTQRGALVLIVAPAGYEPV